MDCNMMSVAASFYKAILAVTTGISVPFNNLAIIYRQQLQDIKLYTFYMELDLQKPYPTRGSDLLTWEFTNLKYSRVEIDEMQFEWAECMLDYI
ncbi:hypothetical protein ZIOFF_009769 [Zingiber officinale]|uniref:Uncharacterized protein n=1 Tax=Zingiber officinale TaxID=94328 RepID=A0A8J5LRP0_ZINOF|nr:hypothetical protein ZIOFF_069581 [Zingiber officinale]KAG6514102.1 hypothetical protein ZIOFF_024442 [Zingiber officinale]KAG6527643.1 hypothetical protein ZIOFF_009769 [Zingiber officinale]